MAFFIGGFIISKIRDINPPNEPTLNAFLDELQKIDHLEISTSMAERLSVSGDSSGSAFYHWRWKKRDIADVVVWPTSEQKISQIIKVASTYFIPITVRGGGTCYSGAAIPAVGGIVVDLKRFNKFRIDISKKEVYAEAGTSFIHLLQSLEAEGLSLCCYPSSALAATLGGWINAGGKIGLGSYKHGEFINSIREIQVINPAGEIHTLSQREEMLKYFGSNGIYGIITNITLQIVEKENIIVYAFQCVDSDRLMSSLHEIHQNKNSFSIHTLYFMRTLPSKIKKAENSPKSIQFVIVLAIEKDPSKKEQKIPHLNHASYLGPEISQSIWENRFKMEIQHKESAPILMLQTILCPLIEGKKIITYFENLSQKYRLQTEYHGILGNKGDIRLVLITPTDNTNWLHFISSKGILHKTVTFAYQNNSQVYAYGLTNTMYLRSIQPRQAKIYDEQKAIIDSDNIFNPLKITRTKMKMARLTVMFEIMLLYRRIWNKIKGIKQSEVKYL